MSRTEPRLPRFLFLVLPALIAAAGVGCADSSEVGDSSGLAVAAISQPIFDANACDEDGTPASLCARADNALGSCFMAMGGASRVRKEVAQVFSTDITTAVRLVRLPVRLRSQIGPNDPSELEIEIRPVIDGVVATGGEAAYTFGAVRLRDLPYNTDTDVSVVMAPSGLELTPEGEEGEPLEWALIVSVTEGSPGVVGIGCTSSELPGVGQAYQRTQRLIASEWTETAYTRYARTIPFALWFGVADECDYFNGFCGDNATCSNDEGAISCECHEGWGGPDCSTVVETYTASGVITDDSDNPLPDVTLNFSGTDATATTDDNGQWSQSGLSGTVTVTPELENYVFDPSSIEVTEEAADVNFVGTFIPATYAVSGTVLDASGDPIAGVTVSFGGAATAVATDAGGLWSQSGFEGTVTVTPTHAYYEFDPGSFVVTGAASDVDFVGAAIDYEWARWPIPPDSPNNYEISADELTVTDLTTGLVWQRGVSGGVLQWEAAKQYCSNLSIGGVSGWRLPTRIELESIVNLGKSSPPVINESAFPGTPTGAFWSSSRYPYGTNNAWAVHFHYGYTPYSGMNHSSYVRCVR